MTSTVIFKKRRQPVVVSRPADELDRLLFNTTSAKVQVPTPKGATWITVENVLRVEPNE